MAEEASSAAVSPPPPPSTLLRVRQQLFGSPADALLNGSLILATAVFLLSLPFFTRGSSEDFIENVVQHSYVFVLLMAVTILGRTLRLRTLAAFWYVGVFAAMMLALGIGYPLGDIVGSGRVFDSLLVPLLDGAIQTLPVALVFWVLVRRGWQPSISDGLLLGFVLGAGMAIHEDAMYQRVYGDGLSEGGLNLLFPTLGTQSTLSRVEVNGFYHSGWASLTGLAIGASFMLRRFRWAPLIGIAAYVVVVFDHGIGNFIILNRGFEGLGLLWTLDLDGSLPIWLLIGGIVAAVVFEIVVLRSTGKLDRLFPGVARSDVLNWLRRPSLDSLMRVQAARNYSRARRALHYLLWVRRPTDPMAIRPEALHVAISADRLGLVPPALPLDEATA